jgi:hypothetical protein
MVMMVLAEVGPMHNAIGYQDVKVILLKPLQPYFPPPDHYG